ncbi:MAG: branched-chain amino acid ABC transporter permease [Pseudomonadota bacterium]|nr:branched-chain amino acid ABC transporter permease [Pseudomonadota bacterium]
MIRAHGLPLAAILAGAAALMVFGLGSGSYWTIVALNLAMWIALTQSWSLFSGTTGYISLGHVVAYGIGAYVVAFSFKILPLWLSIPLAGVAAGLFALMVALPVLRVRGPYFVILTFGLAELVKYILLNVETGLGKSSRLLFGAPKPDTLLWIMAGLAVAATVALYAVHRSRFGRGLDAIREDETAAETIGIPVVRLKVLAYAASAVIPGMVGGVMALRSTYFEVLQVFNPTISFTIVTIAIIGGAGDARGPILGALFLVGLSELLQNASPQIYLILLGLCLIGCVLFLPTGLVGLLHRKGGAR